MAGPRVPPSCKGQPDGGDIPDKLYFKIGEVAALVGVQTHVLRYWEKEVPAIRPTKSDSNQRRYRRRDVEIFREIRRLLYEERYTLAGARKRILSGRLEGSGDGAGDGEANLALETGPAPEQGPQLAPVGVRAAAPPEHPGAPRPADVDPERTARLERARQGLRDLIRLAGEAV